MVFNGGFAVSGDENKVLDTGGLCFLQSILNQRLVDNRQHLFGHGFRGRKKAGSKASDGENGFADADVHDISFARGDSGYYLYLILI